MLIAKNYSLNTLPIVICFSIINYYILIDFIIMHIIYYQFSLILYLKNMKLRSLSQNQLIENII